MNKTSGRALFVLGIIFLAISASNQSYRALGIVFLVIGAVFMTRDRRRQPPK